MATFDAFPFAHHMSTKVFCGGLILAVTLFGEQSMDPKYQGFEMKELDHWEGPIHERAALEITVDEFKGLVENWIMGFVFPRVQEAFQLLCDQILILQHLIANYKGKVKHLENTNQVLTSETKNLLDEKVRQFSTQFFKVVPHFLTWYPRHVKVSLKRRPP